MLKVKVSHDFKDTYDSSSVMVMKDIDTNPQCDGCIRCTIKLKDELIEMIVRSLLI